MADENSRLVYSTEQAVPRLSRCFRNGDKAKIKPVGKVVHTGLRPSQQKATVRLDRKGRGGKCVTVIEGLRIPQKEREALLKQLKSKLGAGGTVKETCLEIQGDHCDALIAALEKLGYPTKRSSGLRNVTAEAQRAQRGIAATKLPDRCYLSQSSQRSQSKAKVPVNSISSSLISAVSSEALNTMRCRAKRARRRGEPGFERGDYSTNWVRCVRQVF